MMVIEAGKEQEILNGYKPSVSKVMINKELYTSEVYNKILPKYAKKRGGFYSKRSMDLAISMLDLDIGPSTNPEVPRNEIWLLKDWLQTEDN